jgi:hypothetical protein
VVHTVSSCGAIIAIFCSLSSASRCDEAGCELLES